MGPPNSTGPMMESESDFIHFFADVGGYLGLLLGESLISYIIIISKLIRVIGKKLKDKCRKKAEEPCTNPV